MKILSNHWNRFTCNEDFLQVERELNWIWILENCEYRMLLLSLFDNVKCHVDASAVTYFKVFDWLLRLSFMNILVALKKRFALQGNLLWLSIVCPSIYWCNYRILDFLSSLSAHVAHVQSANQNPWKRNPNEKTASALHKELYCNLPTDIKISQYIE